MISIIAAIGKNRELGKDNKLLWHIPEDLKRFKRLTLGHPVIMGRKTYESLGKPLPGRANIVVTRQPLLERSDVMIAGSMEEAVDKAKAIDREEIFIIGGGQIYAQALPLADKLYLTLVDVSVPDADTFFPDYSEFNKIETQETKTNGDYHYQFVVLTR